MAQAPVIQFFTAIKQDEALKAKCQAATEAKTCVQLAADRGYHFTLEELQAELSKLSNVRALNAAEAALGMIAAFLSSKLGSRWAGIS